MKIAKYALSISLFCALAGSLSTSALAAAPGEIDEPAGFSHYCSMTWPGGGWAYQWGGSDPCGDLEDEFGPGDIRKAGLYSTSGANQAVVWCDGQTWGPVYYRGNGTGPLTAAFDDSVDSAEPNCVMTVSPLALPIFGHTPGTFTGTTNGVDFARDDAGTLDTGDFGATGVNLNSAATQVNYKGHAKTGYGNNHDGYDWLASEGTDLFAVARGKVIFNRDYQTSAVVCATAAAAWISSRATNNCVNRDFAAGPPSACSSFSDPAPACQTAIAAGNYIDYRNSGWDGNMQGEVYVRHKIVTSPATYNESFVVGYFHVKRTNAPIVGTNLVAGDQVADVGNTGWTTAPHLHMTVIRETNVGTPTIKDRWFTVNLDSCTNCTGGSHEFHHYAVDPYGWQAPANIDPRGWATKNGAMSPKLWQSGITIPDDGTWGD
ncbi:M23 family metallopeptidase [Sorangium sp. So ce1153]|uniref:M23 family metallopeptidase n=1 Tax=Sorangium sp. So ce1153 TaxID=3133333 RepID=UPI003F5D8675